MRNWRSRITEGSARRLLSELIQIPSVNPGAGEPGRHSGEAALAEFVADYFRVDPVELERQEILPGRCNLLVRWPQGRADREILLEAHLDTVPAAGMADPFRPRFENGRLYGRGACDTKGSLAAMMLVIRALLDSGISPGCTLTLLGAADEEYRTLGMRHYLDSGAKPSLAVVGEPTELEIATAQRGNMQFKITVHGRAGHASRPEVGANAIYRMSEIVLQLRELGETRYRERQHPLCGSPTLNVGCIEGGTEAWIIPDRCTVAVDRRWIPGESWHSAWEEIRDLVFSTGWDVEVEEPVWRVAEMETAENELVVRAMKHAQQKVLGSSRLAGAPFTTEASLLKEAGIPAVIFGPGSSEQAHSTEEFVEVAQVVQAACILGEFVLGSGAALQERTT